MLCGLVLLLITVLSVFFYCLSGIREAVFLHLNKYHHATFEVMKKGRWELFFCDMALRENIKKEISLY